MPSKSTPAKDNPIIGTIYFLIYGMSTAPSNLLAKGAYERIPEVTTWQMLFGRALSPAIIMILYVNVDAKKVMYDAVDREVMPSLIFRTVQFCILLYLI